MAHATRTTRVERPRAPIRRAIAQASPKVERTATHRHRNKPVTPADQNPQSRSANAQAAFFSGEPYVGQVQICCLGIAWSASMALARTRCCQRSVSKIRKEIATTTHAAATAAVSPMVHAAVGGEADAGVRDGREGLMGGGC